MRFVRHHQILFSNIAVILIFILISIISNIILLHTNYLYGATDMQFHFSRIKELIISIKHGYFLPSFSFNEFHGSAVMSFYPYINLYPIYLLSLFIKSKIFVIYVFYSLNVFLSLMISYYGSKFVSQSKETSFIFSLVYGLSTTFVSYGFHNMDLGELTAIAVFPLIVFGFFNWLITNNYLQISLGFILLIYSHVLSAMLAVMLVAFLLIINYKKFSKKKIYSLLKMAVLIMIMTAIVWVPMVSIIINNIGNLYPPSLDQLQGNNFERLFINGMFGHITYGLSALAILSAFLPIIFYKYIYVRFNYITKQFYWISILIILICSKFFPWKLTQFNILKIFNVLQFTWRLYIIPEILLSYVFAVCITKCINNTSLKYSLISIFIVIAVFLQIMSQYNIIQTDAPIFTQNYINRNTHIQKKDIYHDLVYSTPCSFKTYRTPGDTKVTSTMYYKLTTNKQINRLIRTYTICNTCDYYPIQSLSQAANIFTNRGVYNNKRIYIHHVGYNTFTFNSPLTIKDLKLPLLYYKHENLHVYINHHLIHFTNKDGLVTVHNIRRGHNNLYVKYIPNIFIISVEIIMLFIGIIWIILNKCKIYKFNKYKI